MSDESERPGEPSAEQRAETQPEEPMTNPEDDETVTDRGNDPDADGEGERERGFGGDLRRTANYALLAGLLLVALIATLQLYFNVSSVINQWIAYEYQSLFQAAFNLTVLLLVGSALIWQTRRLRD